MENNYLCVHMLEGVILLMSVYTVLKMCCIIVTTVNTYYDYKLHITNAPVVWAAALLHNSSGTLISIFQKSDSSASDHTNCFCSADSTHTHTFDLMSSSSSPRHWHTKSTTIIDNFKEDTTLSSTNNRNGFAVSVTHNSLINCMSHLLLLCMVINANTNVILISPRKN